MRLTLNTEIRTPRKMGSQLVEKLAVEGVAQEMVASAFWLVARAGQPGQEGGQAVGVFSCDPPPPGRWSSSEAKKNWAGWKKAESVSATQMLPIKNGKGTNTWDVWHGGPQRVQDGAGVST